MGDIIFSDGFPIPSSFKIAQSQYLDINSRVGPDIFFGRMLDTGYPAGFKCRISGIRPDIQPTPVSGKYPVIRSNYRISGRITGQITTY